MGSDNVIEPLLYIEQPHIEQPLAYMQQTYYGECKEEESSHVEAEQSVETEIIEADEKRFDRMTISEKITYLLRVPKEVPPLKCVIYTKEGNFQGVISDVDDTTVTIKRFGRHDARVKQDDIVQIKLIGF